MTQYLCNVLKLERHQNYIFSVCKTKLIEPVLIFYSDITSRLWGRYWSREFPQYSTDCAYTETKVKWCMNIFKAANFNNSDVYFKKFLSTVVKYYHIFFSLSSYEISVRVEWSYNMKPQNNYFERTNTNEL